MSISPNKKYIPQVILAACFVLTVIVTVLITAWQQSAAGRQSVRSLLLVDPNGAESVIDAKSDNEAFQMMVHLVNRATRTEPPDSLDDTSVFQLFVQKENEELSQEPYRLYSCLSQGHIRLLLEADGEYRSISDADCTAFLSSPYAASLYTSSCPPKLFVETDSEVLPIRLNWYYLSAGGSYIRSPQSVTSESVVTYYQNGQVRLHFDINPDSAHIIIQSEEELLFEGSLEELEATQITVSGTLTIRLDAEWKQQEAASYYGTARYEFRLEYLAPAVFTPLASEVSVGGILMIRCENILTPAEIQYVFPAGFSRAVAAYRYGSLTYQTVRISNTCPAGTYELNCFYGGTQTAFKVTVRSESPEPKTVTCAAKYNATAMGEFNRLFLTVSDFRAENCYLASAFSDPYAAYRRIRYGDLVVFDGAEESVTADYAEYALTSGTAVFPLNSGTVCATGYSSYLGYYVVIDHGGGIQTWYGHLSGIYAQSGQTVSKGQAIGISGIWNHSDEGSLILYVSVNGVKTDPALLTSSGASLIP